MNKSYMIDPLNSSGFIKLKLHKRLRECFCCKLSAVNHGL